MRKRVLENALYVFQEEWLKYAKPIFAVFILLFGFLWVREYVADLEARAGVYAAEQLRVEVEQGQDISQLNASLSVPKIGIEAPITFMDTEDPAAYREPLKRGVAHYPSAIPGDDGTAILLGHSAPWGWFGNTYQKIFSNINALEPGDIIQVEVNGTVYKYIVHRSFYIEGGEQLPEEAVVSNRSRLLLISCWPPGQDDKRIIVQADLIEGI